MVHSQAAILKSFCQLENRKPEAWWRQTQRTAAGHRVSKVRLGVVSGFAVREGIDCYAMDCSVIGFRFRADEKVRVLVVFRLFSHGVLVL